MIRLDELQEAIAECEGERDPNANTCIKLAAFYTIRKYMYGKGPEAPYNNIPQPDGYSYQAEEEKPAGGAVKATGGSDFSNAVDGMPLEDFVDIMDELMQTIEIIQPRLYAGVMRKIKSHAL